MDAFWHPFGMRFLLARGSGGVAALNPRLRSGIPSGCLEPGLFASFRDAVRQSRSSDSLPDSNLKG